MCFTQDIARLRSLESEAAELGSRRRHLERMIGDKKAKAFKF